MKAVLWIVIVLVLVIAIAVRLLAKDKSSDIEVRKIEPQDDEILEEWVRVTTEEDVLGVNVTRVRHPKWNWEIYISAAEFVRSEPLASRLHEEIKTALQQVRGVKAVAHEDTEKWIVQGDANGADMVRNCARALDKLAPEIRKHLENP